MFVLYIFKKIQFENLRETNFEIVSNRLVYISCQASFFTSLQTITSSEGESSRVLRISIFKKWCKLEVDF